MIAIIDYNAGNLRSIEKAVELYHNKVVITNNIETIYSADKVILPGVGNFEKAIEHLLITQKYNNEEITLKDCIINVINNNTPFLGICLGMQLLLNNSEECKDNSKKGLGVINGNVLKFKNVDKIPHMGWNNVNIVKDTPLFNGINNNEYFYFVHSYFVSPTNSDDILGLCNYGIDFTCVLNKKNIYATQFHPEKSGKVGLKLIENFVELI